MWPKSGEKRPVGLDLVEIFATLGIFHEHKFPNVAFLMQQNRIEKFRDIMYLIL